MSNDSKYFHTKEQLIKLGGKPIEIENPGGPWIIGKELYLPLYEGKMIYFFDHRYNSVTRTSGQKGAGIPTTIKQYQNPNYTPTPRYWVKKDEVENRIPKYYKRNWFLSFRDITKDTNERTMIISNIPRLATGHKLPLILTSKPPKLVAVLLANMSSICLDYISRQKLSGTSMAYYYIEQFPIFSPEFYNSKLTNFITERILPLVYTSEDMRPFASDCGYYKEPFLWNENKRNLLKAELDAIFAFLYKISKEDLEYILEQFPILKRKEENQYGEYKTKRLVLEAYDRLGPKLEEMMNE